MTIEYTTLEPVLLDGASPAGVFEEDVFDAWGEELRHYQADTIKEAIDTGTLAKAIADEEDSLDLCYIVTGGREEGAYNFIRLLLDTRDGILGCAITRVPASGNPYRKATIDEALDCVEALAESPDGLLALAHLAYKTDEYPETVTAPEDVRAEVAAYLAALGVKQLPPSPYARAASSI